MNLIRFISLFYKIKPLFSYLPKDIQKEVVDDMEDTYTLCVISKVNGRR